MLVFETDLQKSIEGVDAIFLVVGTPSKDDGGADLTNIFGACEELKKYISGDKIVVIKSTVPVGIE